MYYRISNKSKLLLPSLILLGFTLIGHALPESVLIESVLCQSINQDVTPIPSQKATDFSNPEREMLSRNLINREEQSHRETIKRARETAQLASSIRDDFLKTNSLAQINQKDLTKIEKLVKRIRSDAGGSDSQAEPVNEPATFAEAVERLVKLTESLRAEVEHTPRQVISALTIDLATQTINLLRAMRNY